MATGAPSPSSLPDFLLISQPAAAARKRGQSAAPPAPASRYGLPGSVSRNGGLGESRHGGTGGCAAGPIAASPSDPLVPFPSLGKVHSRKRRIPPPRRRVPLPTAAKEPKRRFWRVPLVRGFSRRAKLEWRVLLLSGHAFLKESLAKNFVRNCVSLLLGPPGFCHAVWLGRECGPMRHRPLPQVR